LYFTTDLQRNRTELEKSVPHIPTILIFIRVYQGCNFDLKSEGYQQWFFVFFVVVVCLVFFSLVSAAFLANKDVYNLEGERGALWSGD